MKIVILNGGPRKGKNTDQMIDSLVEGIKSVSPDAEIQHIRLYDYLFTGCKSCFACQLTAKRNYPVCQIKDSVSNLISDTLDADGIVFASPVYYMNVTAQLRAFTERLMYPGARPSPIPTAVIYTMNATEEQEEQFMSPMLQAFEMYLEGCFGVKTLVVQSCNTFQYNDKPVYNEGFRSSVEAKKGTQRGTVPDRPAKCL